MQHWTLMLETTSDGTHSVISSKHIGSSISTLMYMIVPFAQIGAVEQNSEGRGRWTTGSARG
eukprot:2130087-Pleurochrysis_carterae.AAC.2